MNTPLPAASPRMHVLCITDTYVGGCAGSERFLQRLSQGLAARGVVFTILQLTTREAIPHRSGTLDPDGRIRVLTCPVQRVYGPAGIRAWRQAAALLKGSRVDIVQSMHEKADILNALLPRFGGRHAKISSRRDMGFKKGRVLRLLFRSINGRFDRIVAPSAAIIESLRLEGQRAAARLEVIHNGTDLDRFSPMGAAARGARRRALGIGEDEIVFVCVGNLKAVKGHTHLLAAFARVAAGLERCRLLLVGEGELGEELRRETEQLGLGGRVRFLGRREDVEHILAAGDVLVLASLSEGLSNALVEGAAAGLPVVATRVGGNAEIVEDGRSGLLVPAGDSRALADAMLRMASSEQMRQAMGMRARRRALEGFSLEAMLDGYLRLYEGLAPGQASQGRGRAAEAGEDRRTVRGVTKP